MNSAYGVLVVFFQVEQKTLSTLRSFLHRKHSTSSAPSTISSADYLFEDHVINKPGPSAAAATATASASVGDQSPTSHVAKPPLVRLPGSRMEILPPTQAAKAATLPRSMSYAQARTRPFLKRQWSEDPSAIQAASRRPQHLELSSLFTTHAPPFTSGKLSVSEFPRRKIPMLRRSISSSPLSPTYAPTWGPPSATVTSSQDSTDPNCGAVDMRTRIRDSGSRSEGNSPLDGSNKPPIGGASSATSTRGAVSLEISSDEEDRPKELKENPDLESFHAGRFEIRFVSVIMLGTLRNRNAV